MAADLVSLLAEHYLYYSSTVYILCLCAVSSLLRSTRHGSDPVIQELYGDTRNSNADASVSEMHYTTPHFDKRKAHEMLWMGDKANDVTSITPCCASSVSAAHFQSLCRAV